MNGKHRKTLEAIFSNPVNGAIPWSKVEGLLIALGCRVIEGVGSSITVEKDGIRAYFHRPHPEKESLRYRIKDARDFLTKIGIQP
ncbi:MAG: type II toxin-antitoxin system HicA family toxin [Methylococcaceae bacterium]|jgi:hypothetical protein